MKTNSELPDDCIKGTALHTRTDGYVFQQDTDNLDGLQKTGGKNSCGQQFSKKPTPD